MQVSRRTALGLIGGTMAGAASRGAATSALARPIELEARLALTQGGWLRGRAAPGVLLLDGRTVPLAPDGLFFIAFDRDAPARASLVSEATGRVPVRTAADRRPAPVADRTGRRAAAAACGAK